MKNRFYFIPFLTLLLSVLIFIYLKKIKTDIYFDLIPIELDSDYIPCTPVEIEGIVFNVIIDLGFNQFLSLTETSMEKIFNKKFVYSSQITGVRGTSYESKKYEFPEVKIGSESFINLIVGEDPDQFSQDAILKENAIAPIAIPDGLIGWKAFQNKNVFLDLGNSKIAFCDSFSTLKKNGYDVEAFVETPLLLDRDFVECEAAIADRTVRCFLDTGFTISSINTFGSDVRSLDEAIRNPEMQRCPLRISGKSFGIGNFHKLPLNLPFSVDVVLGMDFFIHHHVFIDFKKEKIYFRRNHLPKFVQQRIR